jgi:archaellum component FlaF (FlaF/FlaG flagellin family)
MMSPYRKRHNWVFVLFAIMIVATFLVAALIYRTRVSDLERLVYANCVANERQDAILSSQIEAEIQRVKQLFEPGPIRFAQIEILQDGILALEPPDETECEPPRGTEP